MSLRLPSPSQGKSRTFSTSHDNKQTPLVRSSSVNDEESPGPQERKGSARSNKHKNSVDEFQEQSVFLHEDHSKGLYSLGYMEVKMKSNSQWTRMYAKIVRGCLLFYKSIKVSKIQNQ